MVETTHREIPEKCKLIAIVGPTASGKTVRAVALCRHLQGEIISADSRQVYRHMNLGTGKDLEEYGSVPYHLIDLCDPGEKYNLYRYIRDFNQAYEDILSRGKLPVLCGGSGMYLENALSGIKLPEVPQNQELREKLESYSLSELTEILQGYKTLHNITDIDTKKRAIRAIEIEDFYNSHSSIAKLAEKKHATPIPSLIIGIDIGRNERRDRISKRLRQRLDQGMVEEVRGILDRGVDAEDLIYYGLEYKFLTLYILGKMTYNEMVNQLEIAIHQFAKRQMTWFRGMERRGFKINWISSDLSEDDFIERVNNLLFI